jgi:uncharacterized protein DUF6496
MPERKTLDRARKDLLQGKAPTTQAGEFVREEIEHIREGKHGARSAKQAIAIGLSKARHAGVKLRPPKMGHAPKKVRTRTARDYSTGKTASERAPSRKRSRATLMALQREGIRAASHLALSRQARASARSRSALSRSHAAQQAARTKGTKGIRGPARKAARTRATRRGSPGLNPAAGVKRPSPVQALIE